MKRILEKIKNIDFAFAFGLSLILFLLYWYTLVPTVYSGDVGEITAVTYELGIAHPTGFPLYLLLAKGFSSLVFWAPNFAYSANLFSAFAGAVCLFIMYFVFKLALESTSELSQKNKRFASVLAVCILGTSLTFWGHSIAAKVYTLTAFFLALEFLLMFYWEKTRDQKYIFWISIIFGLSLGVHLTALLFAPAFLVFLFFTDKKIFFNKKLIIKSLLLFIAGLSIYLYLPIVASRKLFAVGGDVTTWSGFVNYITQKDYAFKMANRSVAGYQMTIIEIVRLHLFEFTFFGFVLASYGGVFIYEKSKKIFFTFIALIASNFLLLLSYGNSDDLFVVYRYFLQSYVAMSIFILFGIAVLLERILKIQNKKIKIIAMFILCLIPVLSFSMHWYENNQHDNRIVEYYSKNVLNSVSEKSILFSLGDSVSGPLWYLQLVEKMRSDVILIEYSLLTRDWYLNHISKMYPEIIPDGIKEVPTDSRFKKIVDHNFGKINMFATFNSDSKAGDYQFMPHGLVYKLDKTETKILSLELKKENDILWSGYNFNGIFDSKFYKDEMVSELVYQYLKSHQNLAVYYYTLNDLEMTKYELEEALKIDKNDKNILSKLGTLYKEMGDLVKSQEYLMRANNSFGSFSVSSSFENNKFESYMNEALSAGKQGDHKKAIELFEQAKMLDPKNETVNINLGIAYALTSDFARAIAAFEEVVKINPKNIMAHYNLGTLYMNDIKDLKLAIDHFQKVLEIDPQHPQRDDIQKVIVGLVQKMMDVKK